MGRAQGHIAAADVVRRGQQRFWTDERILAELRRFTSGRTAWPKKAEFYAAGEGNLWAAVRDHDGARVWAPRIGLPLRAVQDRRPRTDAELVAEARAIVAERGHLPNAMALRAEGHIKLATRVSKSGGARRFRAQHGI